MKKNIKIAMLDSGISSAFALPEHVHFLGGHSFSYDYLSSSIVESSKIEDMNGHGTLCISTILSQFTHIDFYILRMLSASGMTNEAVFLRALEYAADTDADVIAVCSSYINGSSSDRIKALCAEIHARKKILVTSVRNGESVSEPACYDTVIGVRGGSMPDDKYYFCQERQIQMQCATDSVLTTGLFGQRIQFQGTSRSAALATAHIASAIFMHPDKKDDIASLLAAGSCAECEEIKSHGPDIYIRLPFDAHLEEQLAENDENYVRLLYLLCDFFICEDPQLIRTANLIDFKSRFFLRNSEVCLRSVEELFGITIRNPRSQDLQYAYLFYDRIIKPLLNGG
ncbi:MAG: S8 family serine peptidase [Oscillospiraceae bacterium]|nr:S8 family serine peptidase [Oscillospiraceae bacterium]